MTENNIEAIRSQLKSNGLKITPQRVSVLQAMYTLKNHPSAEQIIHFIHQTNPNIAPATVYKTLDILVKNRVITKFRTEGEAARYDAILTPHHHLLSSENEQVEDYENEALNQLLESFFEEHDIPGFEIQSIKLQINGKFLPHWKKTPS